MNRIYSFLILFFISGQIINCFLPNEALLDERLFIGVIMDFGKNYLPGLEQIREMNSPMGPVYFILYGFIGKLSQFSLFWMRSIHIGFSTLLLYLVYLNLELGYKIAKPNEVSNISSNREFQRKILSLFPVLLTILFFLNPYFVLLTAYLLYTDIIGLIFVFAGSYFYLQKKRYLWSAFLWGMAICTRQLFIVIPLAALFAELSFLYEKYTRTRSKISFQDLKPLAIFFLPFLMFLPLFILWDFKVNSGNFQGRAFEENTIAAFSFSFKSLNYSLMLVGIYSGFVVSKRIIPVFKKINFYSLGLTLLLLVLGFPLQINKGLGYGSLPDTAGVLDIIMNKLGLIAYLVIPVLLYWGITFIHSLFRLPYKSGTFFFQASLILFLFLETIYSYCWDKHFLLIIPMVWILCFELLANQSKALLPQ